MTPAIARALQQDVHELGVQLEAAAAQLFMRARLCGEALPAITAVHVWDGPPGSLPVHEGKHWRLCVPTSDDA